MSNGGQSCWLAETSREYRSGSSIEPSWKSRTRVSNGIKRKSKRREKADGHPIRRGPCGGIEENASRGEAARCPTDRRGTYPPRDAPPPQPPPGPPLPQAQNR